MWVVVAETLVPFKISLYSSTHLQAINPQNVKKKDKEDKQSGKR
jgi:hypothetical protein